MEKYVSGDSLKYYHQKLTSWVNEKILGLSLGGEVGVNDVLDMMYPVGSIYISVNETNPSLLFNGTWEQINDVFLLASGSTYMANTVGGEAEHVLTVEEIPSHNHTYVRHKYSTSDDAEGTGNNGYAASNKTLPLLRDNTGDTGGGLAHNNMPPYLAVYMWKRIS